MKALNSRLNEIMTMSKPGESNIISQKMYGMYCRLDKSPIGVELINQDDVLKNGQQWLEAIDIRKRGFAQFGINQTLEFLHRRKLGRKPLDFESFGSFWLMSNSCKEFFQDRCSQDVEFVPGTLSFEDRVDKQNLWLCDVVSVVDALDEEVSDIKIVNHGSKIYNLSGSRNLVFRMKHIGNKKLFRMRYAEYMVICNEAFRNEFQKTGLKGIMFVAVGCSNNR